MLLLLALAPLAQADGPGIVQQAFSSGQLFTAIHTFPASEIGASPTIADFQHGYLYTGSGGANQPFRSDNWYSISNPTSPVLVERQPRLGGDKPHAIGFWGDYFTTVTNGAFGRVMNFDTRTVVSTHPGTVNSIWDSVQAPYVFSGAHGYAAEASRIEIFDFTDPATPVIIKTINNPPFKVGSLHAIGNLLIVSASQGSGAGVYDISDPINPVLLSAKTTGNAIYTSGIYGSRLFNCEQGPGLVRVWDYSNPLDIKEVAGGSTVNIGGAVRYIGFQDGKAHVLNTTTAYKIVNTQTLAIEQSITLPSAGEFSFPFSNLAFVGGASGARQLVVLKQEIDSTGPDVVYLNPANGATNVPVTSRVGLSMSDSIDVRSLTATSFIVRPTGGSAVAGTYSTQMGVINFTPATPLQTNTVYEVVLPAGGVKDVVGNGLVTAFSASFTTSATGGTVPSAPTNLVATATTTSQSTLSWTRNSTNEYKFIVERKTGAGAYVAVGAAGNGATSYKDFGLTPGTSYTYRVRAVNPFGASSYSNESAVTSVAGMRIELESMTLASNVEVGRLNYASGGQYTMIASGASGTATTTFAGATGTYDVTVAYYEEYDGAGSYQLNRNATALDSWTSVLASTHGVAAPGNVALRKLTGVSLTNGDSISLVMTLATGDRAPADYIEFVSVSSGAPAKAITPNPLHNALGVPSTTTLSWSNGGGATSYDVYFGTNPSPGSVQLVGNQTASTYTPATLAASTQYWWRIDARNASGTTTGDVWTFTTAASPTGGLAAHYAFDEAAGATTVTDSVGGFHGTTSSVTLQPTSGRINGDVLFPDAGTTGYVSLPNAVLNNRQTVSVSFWMKSSNTGGQAIVSGANATQSNEFLIYLASDTSLDLWVHGVTVTWSGLGDLTTGTFRHIAVILDGTTDQAELYVDNVSKGTRSIAVGTLNIAGGGLILGQEQDSVGGGFSAIQDYAGELDQLKFFDKVLTAADVEALFNDTNSLIAHYAFDEAVGATTVTDLAGGFNGATSNVTLQPATGRINGDVLFPDAGTTGYISLPNAVLNNRQTVSVSFWMKSSNTGGGALVSGANTTTSNEFLIFMGGTDTSLDFYAHGGFVTWGGLPDLTSSTWRHVVLLVNAPTDQVELYLDGVSRGVKTLTVNTFSIPPGGLILGQEQDSVGGGFSADQDYYGEMDQLKFFNTVLTPAEVGALFSETNSVPVIDSVVASPNPVPVGTSVTFTTTASDSDAGTTLEYAFQFGDGASRSFSTSNTASHSYTAPGRYTVTAQVRDGSAPVQSETLVEIVHNPLTANPPTRSSSIVYDASRNKVWNVNPDTDTVTRIDGITGAKDFERSVGASPGFLALRPGNNEVWVTCEDTAEIRVLDAGTGNPIATITLSPGSSPMGIAFAPNGAAVYVALKGLEFLTKIDPATRAVVANVDVAPNVRSVAVSGDSSKIYVARFISPVLNPLVPTGDRGEVYVVTASSFGSTPAMIPLPFDTTPDAENGGRGVPNYLLDVTISPDGNRAWVPSKKDNTARGLSRDGLPLGDENTVRSNVSQLNLATNVEVVTARKDINDRSLTSAVVFSPVGDLAFVSFLLNNEVRAFNTVNNNDLAGVSVGSAPLGLAMKPDGTRLYVHEFLGRSVSIFDTSGLVAGTSANLIPLGTTATIATETLPSNVLNGKRIFYNASDGRMSLLGYQSCAACHLEGSQDGRTWDFTDRGEGLRNTVTMQGRGGMAHGLVHWSGNFDEIQDFEHDIRGAIVNGVQTGFGGSGFLTDTEFNTGTRNQPLGLAKAGVDADLDALAAYVASLIDLPRSPYRDADGTLTASAEIGRTHFQTLSCQDCHGGSRFTDSRTTAPFIRHNLGTIKASSGTRLGAPLDGFDTPTLKGVWATAPYLHDGSAAELLEMFNTSNAPSGTRHAAVRTLTTPQQQQLMDFLLQIDDLEPAVAGSAPNKAIAPAPANNATNVSTSAGLHWTDGGGATRYSIYFGTDSTPDSTEFIQGQSGTSFNPGPLAANTQYWWRIDVGNANGVTTGDVWTFTTGTTGGVPTDYLAWFKFDDPAGSMAVLDESTNNYDGVVSASGMDLQPVSGRDGGDILFADAGAVGDVSLPNGIVNGRTNLTVSFWMKSSNTGQQTIVSGANSGQSNDCTIFFGTDTSLDFYSQGGFVTWANLPDMTTGTWRHVVVLVNGTSDQVELYVDGISQGVKSLAIGTFSIATGGLRLGQEQDSVGGGYSATQDYDGELDNLRFYGRVLTAAEVQALYYQ